MITGVHAIMYSKRAEKMRVFFRDVLEFRHVDAGEGWLIFALPPAELAFHPTRARGFHELYLMCDDIKATVRRLRGRGVKFAGRIKDQGWGLLVSLRLPDGGSLGLYEPRHATPLRIKRTRSRVTPEDLSRRSHR